MFFFRSVCISLHWSTVNALFEFWSALVLILLLFKALLPYIPLFGKYLIKTVKNYYEWSDMSLQVCAAEFMQNYPFSNVCLGCSCFSWFLPGRFLSLLVYWSVKVTLITVLLIHLMFYVLFWFPKTFKGYFSMLQMRERRVIVHFKRLFLF